MWERGPRTEPTHGEIMEGIEAMHAKLKKIEESLTRLEEK